jgi:glycogen(starch) synthase
MRLVLVNHEFPPLGDGAATATARVAEQLGLAGHAVLVLTTGPSDCPLREIRNQVEIVRLPTRRRSLLAPTTAELLNFGAQATLRLTDYVRQFQADGVLAFFTLPSGLLATRSARKLTLPLIVSPRGSDVPGFAGGRLSGWLPALSRPLIRRVLRRADFVAPNCQHLRNLAVGFQPSIADKTHVVPNGVDLSQVADRPNIASRTALRLVVVGQLIARKRVERVLQALLDLRPLPARLTIVGDGPQRKWLETQARQLGIAAQVDFRGFRPREEVPAILRTQDIYVSTSLAEGMSNACLEAMAAGLPVVTTANGTHELVETAQCGEVVGLEDSAGLAAALRKLNDVAERQRRAVAGLRYVRGLTWQASAEQYVHLFERAREDRRRAEIG